MQKVDVMTNPSQHVIANLDGGWSVKSYGMTRASKRFQTQREAIVYARQVARSQNSALYVHAADGTVHEKISL